MVEGFLNFDEEVEGESAPRLKMHCKRDSQAGGLVC